MNSTRLASVFAACFGLFLGLALLKFGNPPIMEKWVESPTNAYEFVLGSPWPITWSYRLLFLLAVLGLVVAAKAYIPIPRRMVWVNALPLIWLICQVIAAAHSVDDQLSWPTLKHFTACIVCFYLGLLALARVERPGAFWIGLLFALALVIVVGWEQHFGGLQATREYFYREIYPKMHEVSPDYLKKLASNRIFSTLFYPNSLAGALLLFGPVTLYLIGRAEQRLTLPARCFLGGLTAIGMLACLYWSGSKGGWLLMLVLALAALLRLPFGKSLKYGIIALVLAAGLSAFLWKYIGFFHKGATSVSARFDYWEAALRTANANPLTGTGPGTFQIPYKQLKRPESEMARLVHNDYLEQATDSGWLAFAAYSAFIFAALYITGTDLLPVRSFRRASAHPPGIPPNTGLTQGKAGNRPAKQSKRELSASTISPEPSADPDDEWSGLGFPIWLGVLGWALQGLFDFGLYIPALAWPAFAFLGLLLGRTQIASTKVSAANTLAARHENPVPQRA